MKCYVCLEKLPTPCFYATDKDIIYPLCRIHNALVDLDKPKTITKEKPPKRGKATMVVYIKKDK